MRFIGATSLGRNPLDNPRDIRLAREWLRTAAWLGGALLILVVACSAAPTSPSGSNTLDYTRRGGFAGVDDHLVISDNRSAVLTRKNGTTQFTLNQATYARLQTDLQASGFERLNATYLPANPCCDQLEHLIQYRGHTVRALDAAVPPALLPLLVTLETVINSHPIPAR